jgi:hypothetical protein
MTIINLYLRNRTFRAIAGQLKVNYNTLTFLCSAYLYYTYVNKLFSYSAIHLFCGYFNGKVSRYYLNTLVGLDLITQAGNNKYTLSRAGLDTIKAIEDNYNTVLYSFCAKHNINL